MRRTAVIVGHEHRTASDSKETAPSSSLRGIQSLNSNTARSLSDYAGAGSVSEATPACRTWLALAIVLEGRPSEGAHATSRTQSECPTKGFGSCSHRLMTSLKNHTCA